jgi:hypothetical protein
MSKIIDFALYCGPGKRNRVDQQGLPGDIRGDLLEFATVLNTFHRDCFSQVGFEDSSQWLLAGTFRASFNYKGIEATPDLAAYKRFDNVLRVVTLKAGSIPSHITYDSSLITRYQTVIVAAAMRRKNIELNTFESWVVYDCGSRFVLDPIDRQDWEQIKHLIHDYRQQRNVSSVKIENVVRAHRIHCA